MKIPSKKIFFVFIVVFNLISCSNDNEREMPLTPCGGGINFTCPINSFCDLGDNCGGLDKKGFCMPIPRECEVTESRICGCDEKEYQNECIARTLGVTKKNDGTCIRPPALIE